MHLPFMENKGDMKLVVQWKIRNSTKIGSFPFGLTASKTQLRETCRMFTYWAIHWFIGSDVISNRLCKKVLPYVKAYQDKSRTERAIFFVHSTVILTFAVLFVFVITWRFFTSHFVGAKRQFNFPQKLVKKTNQYHIREFLQKWELTKTEKDWKFRKTKPKHQNKL